MPFKGDGFVSITEIGFDNVSIEIDNDLREHPKVTPKYAMGLRHAGFVNIRLLRSLIFTRKDLV